MVTSWRWPGVVGLWVLSAIVLSLQTRGHVDGVALFEGHDRALDRRLGADPALEGLHLAAAGVGVDGLYLDVEQLLHRFLDLRLGRVARDLEHHLAVLGRRGRLL